MFCPNCGKDCKDFKFCPDCGRDLQEIAAENRQETTDKQSFEKRRESAKSTSQPICPKCLSKNISVEDIELPIKDPVLYWGAYTHFTGYFSYRRAKRIYLEKQKKGPQNKCLDCSYKWHPKLVALTKRYRPYLEELIGDNEYVVFTGEGGKTLTLAWDGLIIDSPDGPKKSALHPFVTWYWDLHSIRQKFHEVLVTEPEPRWLTICDKKNKRWPGPGTPELALTDSYTILFKKSQMTELNKIKDALNGIIEENKKAGLL